jgi:hypothetical protein
MKGPVLSCALLLLACIATAQAATTLQLLGQLSLPLNDPSGAGPATEQVGAGLLSQHWVKESTADVPGT